MSIITALKARREALADREAGFTLIELLVVVLIIGILAAIAIPVYLGVQNSAKDAGVKSDLVNEKTALTAFATDFTGKIPSGVTQPGVATYTGGTKDLTTYGWSVSAGNTTTLVYSTKVTNGVTNWCVLATGATTNKFAITTNTSVSGGTPTSACPTGAW